MSQAKPLTYGINKLYYAVITYTNGVASFGTPTRMRGARKLSISPEGANEKFFADNGVYYIADKNNGRSGSIEVVGLNDQFLKDVFGYIEDANGVILEDADAHAAEVALLFECENDGPDPTRFVIFDVKFARPQEEHNTADDGINPDTVTMDYEAAPIELPWGTGETKNFVGGHLDKTTDTASTWAAWYSAVTLPAKPSA